MLIDGYAPVFWCGGDMHEATLDWVMRRQVPARPHAHPGGRCGDSATFPLLATTRQPSPMTSQPRRRLPRRGKGRAVLVLSCMDSRRFHMPTHERSDAPDCPT